MTTLQYVQVKNDLALIDSRVYCRDVIEVNHRYWIQDTLESNKTLIEPRFGILRFKTAETGKPGQPEKYVLLTEPQCNAVLVLSRNIGKVLEKKLDLIADFEAAKQLIKSQLEKTFNFGAATPQAINPQLDASKFDFTFDAAIQVTGHRNKYDTMQRLLGYLEQGKDFYWNGNKLYLCNPIYYSFIAASRCAKGIDVKKIGATVTLDWDYYCRVNRALRTPKNNLFATKRPVDKTYEQLEMPDC